MSRPTTQAHLAHRAKIHGAAIEASKGSPELAAALSALLDAEVGLVIAGADKPHKGDFVPTPKLALGQVRDAIRRLGRKPKHGEPMKVRHIRMTDEQWAAKLRIGDDRVRELIMQEDHARQCLASHGIVKPR